MKNALFGILVGLVVVGAGGWYTPKEFGEFPKPCSPESWVKHGVVLQPTDLAGHYGFQNFNSPPEALGNGRWRVWFGFWGSTTSYATGMNIGVAEGIPGSKMTKHVAVLSEREPADAPLAIGGLPNGWRPV